MSKNKLFVNILLAVFIAVGSLYVTSTPIQAFCPSCETCTGGCTGCFGEECDGGIKDCGKLEDSSGKIIECHKDGSVIISG